MGKKLYVGNLPFSATESSLSELFAQHGTVDTCRLIIDRDTGRSKGFGFVEMSINEEAEKAIASLDGKELDGRALKVNEARPQVERSSGYGSASRDRFSTRNDSSGFAGQRGSRRSF